MKKIILMRHAEASLSPGKLDFERELTDIGKNQANKAAEFIKNIAIDKLLVSSAKRAVQTSEIILSKNNIDVVETLDSFYKSDLEEMLNIVKIQDNIHERLMIISHNPNVQGFIIDVTESDDSYEFLKTTTITPAQICVINLNSDNWSSISLKQGTIDSIFIPI